MAAPAISVTVDTRDFERAINAYAKATGKTVEAALWRQLGNWCVKAYQIVRGVSSKARTRGKLPPIPVSGRDRSSNWRLVRWLASRAAESSLGGKFTRSVERDWRVTAYSANGARVAGTTSRTRRYERDPATGKVKRVSIYGPGSKGFLLAFAKAEKGARAKSGGYIAALVAGAMKAAKRRAAVVQGTGIHARALGHGGDAVRCAVESVFAYASDETRAFRPRSDAGIDRLAGRAFDAALDATVRDMEEYTARKLAERARADGLEAKAR